MFRFIIAALILALPVAASASTCSGADPQITSVTVKSVQTAGALNHYVLTGTVTNQGSAGQASNVLQSVDIFNVGDKLDTKSIPPLKAGESFVFTYEMTRSSDAGKGTTTLGFQLDPVSGCSTGNDRYKLTF